MWNSLFRECQSVSNDLPNDQKVSFQGIKVEPSTLKQSQPSEAVDPLLIHEFKEEIFEENEKVSVQLQELWHVELATDKHN